MPTDESPAQSFARVAAAAEASEGPPAPSPETVAKRQFEMATGHLQAVGKYAQHFATCEKDVSPEALLAGRSTPCSCGLDDALAKAAAFLAVQLT